jgi:arsenate reductase
MLNVLFLCTGNSCRSILAEAYLNHIGNGRIQAFSAGSYPTGQVNPKSLETLQRSNIPTKGLRSKSWDEFKDTPIDLIVTVCDNAAGEMCPIFPGAPLKVHWGVPDPAQFQGTPEEITGEFERVFAMLKTPIDQLAALPLERLQKQEFSQQAKAIEMSEYDQDIAGWNA